MTITDIILRLARRHLPIDAAAPEPEPEPTAHESSTLAAAPVASATCQPADESNAADSGLGGGARATSDTPVDLQSLATPPEHARNAVPANPAVPQFSEPESDDVANVKAPTPQAMQSAAAALQPAATPQPTTHSPGNESPMTVTGDVPSDRNRDGFAPASIDHPGMHQSGAAYPHFDQASDFEPAFPIPAGRPSFIDHQSEDPFEPRVRSTAAAGSSHDQSPIDAVGESGRELEDSARDLESSLTRLFTTQIETLQRLRDKIDEHERRWVEQQSARRAML